MTASKGPLLIIPAKNPLNLFVSFAPGIHSLAQRNYEAELVHARWAMLAAVGCLIPEILDLRGVDLGEPVWWKVGVWNESFI